MKWIKASLLLCLALVPAAGGELLVFAAASTAEVMKELALRYTRSGGASVYFNFASSGALARQIEAGAPADLFVSANVKWMDRLDTVSMIRSETRFNLAANRLVMVASAGSATAFGSAINGPVAVGDFRSVPAGMYAEEALIHMGWLEQLRPRLVMASNVRTALLYVERGETAAGIVYETDALASDKVSIVGAFPADSHSPIIYPVVAVSGKPSTADFITFLKREEAGTVLREHGFRKAVR